MRGLVILLCAPIFGQNLLRIWIDDAQGDQLGHHLETLGFDVLQAFEMEGLEMVIHPDEIPVLNEMGLSFSVIEVGRGGAVPPGYSDLANILDRMHGLVLNHPELCQVVNLTQVHGMAQTFEGRDIFALKISDQVASEADEDRVLIVSNHHAREIVTPELALFAAEQILALYGSHMGITDAVNHYEIWIVPVWNPDGYHEVFVGDNLWRKNRRVFTQGVGVDLNRNYDFGWSSACGGSTTVSSQTYRGPSPASEPETRLMEVFSEDRHFTKILDFHSWGRETLYAYANCFSHVHEAFWLTEATVISNEAQYGNSVRQPSAMGEHYLWQLWAYSNFSFLMETHTEFQPSFSSALQEAEQIWPAIIHFLDRPAPLVGKVWDSETLNPVEAEIVNLTTPTNNNERHRSSPEFGRYSAWVPAGTYEFRVQADGYETFTFQVSTDLTSTSVQDVALVPLCLGNLTGSRDLDVLDGVEIVNHFGSGTGLADLNEDEVVDILDFLIWLPFWQLGCVSL